MAFDFNDILDVIDSACPSELISYDEIRTYGRKKLKSVITRTCMILDNKYNHSIKRKVPGPFELYEMNPMWFMEEKHDNLRIRCNWNVKIQKVISEFAELHKEQCAVYYNSTIFYGKGINRFYISNKEHEFAQTPAELIKTFRTFIDGNIKPKSSLSKSTSIIISLADCEPTTEKPILGLFSSLRNLKAFFIMLFELTNKLDPDITIKIDYEIMKSLGIKNITSFQRTEYPLSDTIRYLDNLITNGICI